MNTKYFIYIFYIYLYIFIYIFYIYICIYMTDSTQYKIFIINIIKFIKCYNKCYNYGKCYENI